MVAPNAGSAPASASSASESFFASSSCTLPCSPLMEPWASLYLPIKICSEGKGGPVPVQGRGREEEGSRRARRSMLQTKLLAEKGRLPPLEGADPSYSMKAKQTAQEGSGGAQQTLRVVERLHGCHNQHRNARQTYSRVSAVCCSPPPTTNQTRVCCAASHPRTGRYSAQEQRRLQHGASSPAQHNAQKVPISLTFILLRRLLYSTLC